MYKTKDRQLPKALNDFRLAAFERLLQHIDLEAATRTAPEDLRREIEEFIISFTEESQAQLNFSEQKLIAAEIVNDMTGLGPIEPLLSDPDITDIFVNGPKLVFIERFGKMEATDIEFRDSTHVLQVAQRIASKIGRRIDEASPMVDARLLDGSRVNVIIPPVALDGVMISIRRFSEDSITLDMMAKNGNVSPKLRDFLNVCATSRLNILVSGGTGAGKTTLLNALSQMINPGERIVTIEDSAELRLQQPHVIRLECRPPNIEGQGEITIRDLVKNSLRMRPDRIVIGECRGAETFDMLQAMNTGHDGSMSTLHANSAPEALSRLENMVMMTGHELPPTVIKTYIATAIDMIVHVSRMRDGVRRITQVTDVMECVDGEVKTASLFEYEFSGVDEDGKLKGEFVCKTKKPHFMQKILYSDLGKELEKAMS